MVKRTEPEKLLPLFENMPEFPKLKEVEKVKEYIYDLSHIFEFIFGKIYNEDELELVYYLIEDFLNGKKYAQTFSYYKSITGDAIHDPRKKIKFVALKRRKEDFDKTFRSLKEKGIIVSPKNKPNRKNEKDKYFWLNLQKLSNQFYLSFELIYFALHYLLLEKSNYENSLEIAKKISPKLNGFFGDK